MMKNRTIKEVGLFFLLFTFIFSCSTDDPIISAVTASAGSDITVTLGETVTLTGSGTSTKGGVLTYLWEMQSAPATSTLGGFAALTANTDFVPDVAGDYTLKLTVVDETGVSATDEVLVTVTQGEGPEEIGGTIATDLTLVNRIADPLLPDYIASTDVFVNAVLTIDPGVQIVFKDDIGMSIASNGAIIAIGTASDNIIFTGVEKTKGFWKGLELESNDANNELAYCTIEYGGSSGFDGANLKSNIMVEGSGKIKITNSKFTNGAGYGLYTRALESNLPEFSSNTFTENAVPIMTRINHYHYFDAASDYTGNNDDYIDSYWSNEDTEMDVTWNVLNVPFRMANNIEQIASDIIIASGTKFIGQPNGGIEVTPNGSLNAVGTASDKITFVGEQDVTGYWKGIAFESNNTNNELTYVVISNGGQEGFDGANLKSNLMVEGSGRLKITNTISSKSGGYGLYTRTLESNLPEFSSNTFTDNAAPVMTRINHYHYFDAASDYTGNNDDYIDSYWSNEDTEMDVTWNALNVPFRMANNIEQIASDIIIAPSTKFIGQPNGGIEIIANGSLNAVGTTTSSIVFEGEQNVVGYWKGLRFLSNNANNVMQYVTISNGGEEGFDGGNRKANIEIGGSGILTVADSKITLSGGNGIRVQSGGGLTQSNLTFSGNVGSSIFAD